jgi:hypothetical protein
VKRGIIWSRDPEERRREKKMRAFEMWRRMEKLRRTERKTDK